MRLLLVEDDAMIGASVQSGLRQEGYSVDWVRDGAAAELALANGVHEMILLDLGLPRKSGLELLASLRRKGLALPVLVITARDSVADRVKGLDAGADDYLVKPFEVDELRARIRALLRRESSSKTGVLAIADLELDPATHTVQRAGQTIDLTAKEFSILEYLMRHPNQLISRERAEEHLWNYDHVIASNVMDVYIRRLRRKIDDPFHVKLIETMRGAGYRIRIPEER
jgi:two-component system response regulator QseB